MDAGETLPSLTKAELSVEYQLCQYDHSLQTLKHKEVTPIN